MSSRNDTFAQINWDPGDIPLSVQFDDPYFARENGRAETRHVFIAANGLPEGWQTQPAFTIAELGFGTGLNFFETIAAWQSAPGICRNLTYVSFERYPMTAADLARALSPWPDLRPQVNILLNHWPPLPETMIHAVELGPITLEIHLGDANTALPAWAGTADAWYLDGFSPAKNPDLWNDDLMAAVHAHTKPGGTFATYTAAGFVRRNLVAAGFQVSKIPGYGRKRESLAGIREP